MALEKITAGDTSIPAETWNQMVDYVQALKDQALGVKGTRRKDDIKSPGLVKVITDHDEAFDQFNIVGLDEAAFPPGSSPGSTDVAFRQFPPQFRVVAPTCMHVGKFAVLLEPLAAKTEDVTPSALAVASGVVQCKVFIDSSSHQFADVDPSDSSRLISCETGSAQILWKPVISVGHTRMCIVRLSNSGDTTCVSTTQTTVEETTEEGTTGEGTTGEGTTGEGTTGTGTTGEGTTGTGTTDEGGGSTTTTDEGGGSTTTTEEGGGTTTTGECPPFECGEECEVSLEVVTDVSFDTGTCELTVTKTTICLRSDQVDL